MCRVIFSDKKPDRHERNSFWVDTKTGILYYCDGTAEYKPPSPLKTVLKTSDETVYNSAVLQDDDHLKLTLNPNEVWLVMLFLICEGSSVNADWKFGLSYPTGCTIIWETTDGGVGWGGVGTTSTPGGLNTETATTSRGGKAGIHGIVIIAVVTNGGNAGTLQFKWCQNTATAENNTLKKNSCMIAFKLAS